LSALQDRKHFGRHESNREPDYKTLTFVLLFARLTDGKAKLKQR
jgi:hypothetical protein